MALEIPTLDEIRNNLANDYELRYQQAGIDVDAHTRGTGHTEKVNAIAALAFGLRLNQKYIVEQLFVSTMSEEVLLKTGAELGVVRIPPAYAQGNVECTGTNGVTIAASSVLSHASGGQYRVVTDTVIAGTTAVPIIALEPGVNGNLNAAETLNFTSPIAGVDSEAAVDGSGLTSGADIEPLERYRDRVRVRRKEPPMGGKYHDYVAWAKAASVDVTRAWVSAHENQVGQIIVRFVAENLANPIPTPALITTVNDYIQTKKPVEANVLVQAPSELPLDLTFTDLVPNTQDVQDAIVAELEDLLEREVRSDGTLFLNRIRAAISNAPGVEDFTITLAANVSIAIDEYAVVGTTTFP